MQLCIDIGNTRIKYGLFKDRELSESGVDDREAVKLIADLTKGNPGINSVIISSVNRSLDPSQFTTPESIKRIFLDHKTPLPIRNDYKSPETLGHDRIALAVAGHSLYPASHVLIIDLGTCMTLDLVDKDGVYRGGSISPGMQLRFNAMHSGTKRLPQLSFNAEQIPPLLGKTTIECMQSGVVQGMRYEITGAIKQLQGQFEDLKVIMTGGDQALFERALKNSIFADPNLVLRGLNEILLFNLS